MVSPQAIDQPYTTKDIGSSSPQGTTANVQILLLQYKDQIFQMLADIKEQMKEQQAQSDRDRKQMVLDRENVIHEWRH